MKLQLERQYANAMLEAFPDLELLRNQLVLGGRAEISYRDLSGNELDYLHKLYTTAGPDMQGRAVQLATIQRALNDETSRYCADDLENLLSDIARYLIDDSIKGWLFRENSEGRAIAYVVTRLDYTPPGEEEAGRILIELKANSRGKIAVETINIRARDVEGKSIGEILAEKGYMKENPELMQNYNASTGRYLEWRSRYGQQFSATGKGYFAEDPTSTHRNTDWSRKNIVVLSSSGNRARLVNDESILKDRALGMELSGDVLAAYLRKAGKSDKYDMSIESRIEEARDSAPQGMFTEIPIHGYILMFHLELHHHLWVHVDDMLPYQYQPELKTKLVLPEEQTDLIDILTAEMDMLMDDIIEGKSGGTTVLCAGPPGVGKTLTAEVYSEIIRRPLYRVHSGQLGLNVAEMEKALKETLTRAQRWGAVMLIDEADVYIKRRDDNIAANAVVGVFLRVLEYFNGLLFLTTNRVDDIDEAIVSRCIAMIKYDPPELSHRIRLWQVMGHQFSLDLDESLVHTLAAQFPAATGRDIKGLAKLVAKFCSQKNIHPTLDVFKRCSIFRGMQHMPT